MKKKEMMIIAAIAIISVLSIVLMKTMNRASHSASTAEVSSETSSSQDATAENASSEDSYQLDPKEESSSAEAEETADASEEATAEPEATTDPASVTVDIYHGDEIVKSFNPSVDNIYHIDGDYGGLDVEVKDGKWHVTNEECPNHICANMGWMGPDDIIPISCLPNDVYVVIR